MLKWKWWGNWVGEEEAAHVKADTEQVKRGINSLNSSSSE